MSNGRNVILVLALLGGVLLMVFREALLAWPAQRLIRDDHPAAGAPFLVVLMGDSTTMRADKAADLFLQGKAKQILMVRSQVDGFAAAGLADDGADLHRAYLERRGIPREQIVIIENCAATSTVEEARCLLSFLQRQEQIPERVPVVTGWYHTRRAGWLLETVWGEGAPRVEMSPALAPSSHPASWLAEEQALLAVFNEYLKTAYWTFKVIAVAPD